MSSQQLPGFLTLPYELRLEIYTLALDQRLGYFHKTYLSISAVNAQIRREVLPIILQNSRYFSSLEKLSDWTSRGDPFLLKQIQNVTVHIFQDSLSPIADVVANNSNDGGAGARITPRFWKTKSAPQSGRANIKSGSGDSLGTKILRALCLSKPDESPDITKDAITLAMDAFTAIDEVKSLWLLFKDSTFPNNLRFFAAEQEIILNISASSCQRVQKFTVFSALVSLNYLTQFHDLRQLRFSGYSTSTPEETLKILKSLKKLDTIIIYRYPEVYDNDNNIISNKLPESLSLTPSVIAQMNPLKHFQIAHMSSVFPSQHLTVSVIQSLRTHLPTLRILQLSSQFPLTSNIVDELLAFLADSKVTDLKIRIVIPKKFEGRDVMSFFPRSCRGGEAGTRNANLEGWVHLAMTASGACHHITHVNRMCICEPN